MTERVKKIEERVAIYFGKISRPSSLFSVENGFRSRHSDEFDSLERFDWETDEPSNLSKVYEPSTFLSPAGYMYLVPKVFNFCLKWRERARDTDFIYVFFNYPVLGSPKNFFSSYSNEQKVSLWHVIYFVNQDLGFEILDTEELVNVERLLTGQLD